MGKSDKRALHTLQKQVIPPKYTYIQSHHKNVVQFDSAEQSPQTQKRTLITLFVYYLPLQEITTNFTC
jgi:hypothetical protein